MTHEEAKKYIGSHWNDNGVRQFEFLKSERLMPQHKLLDVGMGCGRGSRFSIEYLDAGNFYGIEQHQWLIDVAMDIIGKEMIAAKNPHFIVNGDFAVDGDVKFDYIIAKSVLTHLTKEKIAQCFKQLKNVSTPTTNFYASIFLGDSSKNLKQSDDTRKFFYSLKEIEELADGWQIKSLGHKGCVRQIMLSAKLHE